jgi:YHS domain-containing protein
MVRGTAPRPERRPEMAKDPVCGMDIGENQRLKSTYAEKTYFFCSASCKAKFDEKPGRYAEKSGGGGDPHAEHHHHCC